MAARRPLRHLATTAALLGASAVLAACVSTVPATIPETSSSPWPSVAPEATAGGPDPTGGSPRGSAALPSVLPGDDPADLPRIPGSVRMLHAIGRDDGLRVVDIAYHAPVGVDLARAHYRRVLRDEGWRLGEIEVDDGAWELDAVKGTREVELEIRRGREATIIEVTLTEPLGG